MAVASFPALKPTARTFVPGRPMMSTFVAMSGHEERVLLGSDPVGTTVSLEFEHIKEVLVHKILDHFRLANGTFEVFAVPDSIFAGMTSTDGLLPAGLSWRYSGSPSVDWVAPGIASVSLEFVAVRE